MCGKSIEDNAVDQLAREDQVEVTFTVARSVIEQIQTGPSEAARASDLIGESQFFVDMPGTVSAGYVLAAAAKLAAVQAKLPEPVAVGQARVDDRGQAIAIVGLLGDYAWVVEEGDDYPFTLNTSYIERDYATVR